MQRGLRADWPRPLSLRRSVLLSVACGVDEADVRKQVEAAGLTMDQMRGTLIVTADELVERLKELAAIGVDRIVISRRGAVGLASVRMLGERVVSQFR